MEVDMTASSYIGNDSGNFALMSSNKSVVHIFIATHIQISVQEGNGEYMLKAVSVVVYR